MARIIGRLTCRLFGHSWFYQPEVLSALMGQSPARICTRCHFRYCERFIDGRWQFDHEIG